VEGRSDFILALRIDRSFMERGSPRTPTPVGERG
jgi:hypothetical protein